MIRLNANLPISIVLDVETQTLMLTFFLTKCIRGIRIGDPPFSNAPLQLSKESITVKLL